MIIIFLIVIVAIVVVIMTVFVIVGAVVRSSSSSRININIIIKINFEGDTHLVIIDIIITNIIVIIVAPLSLGCRVLQGMLSLLSFVWSNDFNNYNYFSNMKMLFIFLYYRLSTHSIRNCRCSMEYFTVYNAKIMSQTCLDKKSRYILCSELTTNPNLYWSRASISNMIVGTKSDLTKRKTLRLWYW